jgi:hypothetical protein
MSSKGYTKSTSVDVDLPYKEWEVHSASELDVKALSTVQEILKERQKSLILNKTSQVNCKVHSPEKRLRLSFFISIEK